MLRALRFAAQLGFEVEEQTFAAIRELARRLKRSVQRGYRQNWSNFFTVKRADALAQSTYMRAEKIRGDRPF